MNYSKGRIHYRLKAFIYLIWPFFILSTVNFSTIYYYLQLPTDGIPFGQVGLFLFFFQRQRRFNTIKTIKCQNLLYAKLSKGLWSKNKRSCFMKLNSTINWRKKLQTSNCNDRNLTLPFLYWL